jgi:hypothetical protein
VHEIGHSIGGNHGDIGSIMDIVNITEEQKPNCTGNCGTGNYIFTIPSVNTGGVKSIIGRINMPYGTTNSNNMKPAENRRVTSTTSGKLYK